MYLRASWLALAFSILPLSVDAQGPAPLPTPQLDLLRSGWVSAFARQADGSLLVGGWFQAIDGNARSNLARLLPDGSTDSSWTVTADGEVHSIVVAADGSIFIGGSFQHVNGEARRFIAKLASDGTLDPSWNPSPNLPVRTLVLDSTGDSLFVAGSFDQITNLPIRYLAKVATDGAGVVDAAWDLHFPTSVSTPVVVALAVAGDSIYLGGSFTSMGGLTRHNLGRASTASPPVIDPGWHPSMDVCAGGTSCVNALALDGGGMLYVGGNFQQVDGSTRHGLARIATADGAALSAWNPAPNYSVSSVLLSGSDVYIAGSFWMVGATPAPYVARVSTTTGFADSSWNPLPNDVVSTLTGDGAGGVHAGGYFDEIAGSSHFALARIAADGSVSGGSGATIPAVVNALARQHGGGTLVGGDFLFANGQPRRFILRLRDDGTLDPDWHPSPNRQVTSIAVDSADAVFAVGDFNSVDEYARNFAVKLAAGGNGAPDSAWVPNETGTALAKVAIDDADWVYFGGFGAFTVGRATHDGTGALDPDWTPDVGGTVGDLAVDDSWLYVGGGLSTGGQSRGLLRVSTAPLGAVDASWTPSINSVSALCLDGHGALYAGSFLVIPGTLDSHVAKLSLATASVDPTWNPHIEASSGSPLWWVDSIATIDGSVFVAGAFDRVEGQSNGGFVAVDDNTGAFKPSITAQFDGAVQTVVAQDATHVLVGGAFRTVDGSFARDGIAAFDVDMIFADGFD